MSTAAKSEEPTRKSSAPPPAAPVATTAAPKKKSGEIYLTSVSPVAVALSIRHLSIMLKSGLALEAAIKILSEQTPDKRLKGAYMDILVDVQSGKTLAESMAQHTKIFSQVTVSIISIGEQGGTLEKNLVFLAEFLKKNYELQRKVKGALIYPAIVFSLTVVEMLGVMFFILPKLDTLFSSFKEIPAFTVFILNAAKFIRENALAIVVVLAVVVIALVLFLKTKAGKIFSDGLGIKFPIVKNLNKANILTTFSRTLGILLESGIPISKALRISSETIGNHFYAKALVAVHDKVKGGQNLAAALLEYPQYFPITYVKMIEVGESTGSLEENLDHLYDFYAEEVQEMSNNMTTLLEPLLLIFIGAMIGLLAILIIAPIYQLTGSLNA